MKQLLPSKMVEAEDSVRYSSSKVGRLSARGEVPRLHAEPAGEYGSGGVGYRPRRAVTAGRLQNNFFTSLTPSVFSEYAQPLVSGVTTLGARSTFKPDEGPDPGYSDPDLYDAPISPDVYHAYAEPLPASGSEYATPIVVDMGCHPAGGSSLSQQPAAAAGAGCGFMAAGPASLLPRTDGGQSVGRLAYDTPKNATGQVTPTEDLTYQVPQSNTQKPTGKS